jgi:hypothetical protein
MKVFEVGRIRNQSDVIGTGQSVKNDTAGEACAWVWGSCSSK